MGKPLKTTPTPSESRLHSIQPTGAKRASPSVKKLFQATQQIPKKKDERILFDYLPSGRSIAKSKRMVVENETMIWIQPSIWCKYSASTHL